MGAVPLVRVVRSDVEESVHLGHVAVCDAAGRLVAHAGDPDRFLYGRSCTKPLQGAVSLRAIGDLPLPDVEVAVMCGSHTGEPVHLRTIRALLRRVGLDAADLRTPEAYPGDPDAHARARERTRIAHNCSGKHAGMLVACARVGWDLPGYRLRSHPLQRRVTAAVTNATGVADLAIGIDGCGVPVHGVSLHAMATLFARLVRPERLGDLEPHARRAVAAMLAQPYLVGGRDRTDTDLMAATGDVLAKEGAEALTCAGVSSSGLGVAVKIEDGGYRAASPAVLHALRQIDALTDVQMEALRAHARPPVLGGGRPVGAMTPIFDLLRP